MHSSPTLPAPDPQLIESLGAIVWDADPLTLQFVYVNPAAERLLGFPLHDWMSRPGFWVDLLHPDDRETALAVRRAAVADGRDHDFEYRVVAADGSVRCLRDIASVRRGEGGGVDRVRGVLVDLTEVKMRLEQRIQRGGRMEALARITSAVAHDLRNVLTVVQGNVELALDDETAANVRGELLEVVEAANLGKAIIEQLSTFGRRHHRMSLIDANDVLRDLRGFLERLLTPIADLSIDTAATRASVRTESGALQQILLNLVVNAKEAMAGPGGHVAIATRNVRASAPANPQETVDFVEIEVADDGAGMPPHVSERIFELHFTTKAERRGAGIGLATVASIVREAGGTISVESQPRQGTTFRVRLPVVSTAH